MLQVTSLHGNSKLYILNAYSLDGVLRL